ncbi:hypothetical protein [Aliarcobacter thereius]|uniref:hypothetical protein n=1 Tax=Aliarcobacter thereius TaxID=544718 RepID=UPI000825D9D5|nr:hypothetical protein [Aliarcobacter thereius]OCL90531.1 hypothetical protein AAX25_01626 [Aliarcobacter thereius]
MKNFLKVVFLGILGFSLLVFLTIPDRKIGNSILSFEKLPNNFEIVNKAINIKKDEIFKTLPIYLVVLNHDSLAVFKDFKNNLDKNIVFIANISNTPWLIKKSVVESELENMFRNSNTILINDSKGDWIKSLALNDNSMNSYFIYKIELDKKISFISKNSVKMGALQDGISEEEIKEEIERFIKLL